MTSIVEFVGYFSQYLYLKSSRCIYRITKDGFKFLSSLLFNIKLVLTYQKLYLFDLIDYYHRYLILTLHPYLFGTPVLNICQLEKLDLSDSDSDSDSDNDSKLQDYEVIVSQLLFVFQTNEDPPTMTYRVMNGAQLRPFIDDKGRFFIGHIHRYYPSLDTIIIRYMKFETDSNKIIDHPNITKIIDVKKRFDIRNGVSCKFGVYL